MMFSERCASTILRFASVLLVTLLVNQLLTFCAVAAYRDRLRFYYEYLPTDERLSEDVANCLEEWWDPKWSATQVVEIQWMLKSLKLFDGRIDGQLGPNTQQSLCEFVVIHNLIRLSLDKTRYAISAPASAAAIRMASFAESESVLQHCDYADGGATFDLGEAVSRDELRRSIDKYMKSVWAFSDQDALLAINQNTNPNFPKIIFIDKPDALTLAGSKHIDWETSALEELPKDCHYRFHATPRADESEHATSTSGIVRSKLNGFGILGVLPFLDPEGFRAIPVNIDADETLIDVIKSVTEDEISSPQIDRIVNLSLSKNWAVCRDYYNRDDREELPSCKLLGLIDAAKNSTLFVVSASDLNNPKFHQLHKDTACTRFPACYGYLPNVITVGALGKGVKSWGNRSLRGGVVKIAAPGHDILTTHIRNNNSHVHLFRTGTSIAAPFVTAAAARVIAEIRNQKNKIAETLGLDVEKGIVQLKLKPWHVKRRLITTGRILSNPDNSVFSEGPPLGHGPREPFLIALSTERAIKNITSLSTGVHRPSDGSINVSEKFKTLKLWKTNVRAALKGRAPINECPTNQLLRVYRYGKSANKVLVICAREKDDLDYMIGHIVDMDDDECSLVSRRPKNPPCITIDKRNGTSDAIFLSEITNLYYPAFIAGDIE